MLGAGRSRRLSGVKGNPSCTHGGKVRHEMVDEDNVLTKSSEGNTGASDKMARVIRSGRDLPMVKIAKQSTHINIGILA